MPGSTSSSASTASSKHQPPQTPAAAAKQHPPQPPPNSMHRRYRKSYEIFIDWEHADDGDPNWVPIEELVPTSDSPLAGGSKIVLMYGGRACIGTIVKEKSDLELQPPENVMHRHFKKQLEVYVEWDDTSEGEGHWVLLSQLLPTTKGRLKGGSKVAMMYEGRACVGTLVEQSEAGSTANTATTEKTETSSSSKGSSKSTKTEAKQQSRGRGRPPNKEPAQPAPKTPTRKSGRKPPVDEADAEPAAKEKKPDDIDGGNVEKEPDAAVCTEAETAEKEPDAGKNEAESEVSSGIVVSEKTENDENQNETVTNGLSADEESADEPPSKLAKLDEPAPEPAAATTAEA